MSSSLTGFTLVVAVVAAAAAGYAVVQQRSQPSDVEVRLEALEAQIARLERQIGEPLPEDDVEEVPPATLSGVRPPLSPLPGTRAEVEAIAADTALLGEPSRRDSSDEETAAGRDPDALEELVEKAVEKKAAQIQIMQGNKKPPIDVFAKTLELTDDQRYAVERAVVSSQREIKSILEIPTEDGSNLMDELVEIFADGMAHPGENPGRGMKFFGRVLSEKIPGSSETYAERIEVVKEQLRGTFKREMDDKQYAAFEAWQMDPSEIEDIEGSPWKEVEARVIERAKELGAEIPDAADR